MTTAIRKLFATRNTAPSTTTTPEREILIAELELTSRQLPEVGLLVRAGRRSPSELQALEARIATLEAEIAGLDAAEVARTDRETQLRELMPARIEELRDLLDTMRTAIDEAARAQSNLDRAAKQVEVDFGRVVGNFVVVPPEAHDLVALARAWTNDLSERSAKLASYLDRFRQVVRGEQEPPQKPSKIDLMSADEKQAIQDADRERKKRS